MPGRGPHDLFLLMTSLASAVVDVSAASAQVLGRRAVWAALLSASPGEGVLGVVAHGPAPALALQWPHSCIQLARCGQLYIEQAGSGLLAIARACSPLIAEQD